MKYTPVLKNRELKKHIQKAVFPHVFEGMLFCIVLLVLNSIMVINWIKPLVQNTSYLEGKYNKVVLSNKKHTDYCFGYQFTELITVSSENSHRINANTYIFGNDFGNNLTNCILKQNEIAISERVAEKLNLVIGSKVYLEFPFSDSLKEYTVAAIIPYCWNYYDVLENTDFSVVHIGYDDDLINRASMKYVYFLSDNEYMDFANRDLSYTNYYDLNVEIQTMKSRITILMITDIMSSVLISVGYLLLVSQRTRREAIKYFYNGYEVSFVNQIHLIDYLLLYCIPILIFGINIVILSIVVHLISVNLLTIAIVDLLMFIFFLKKELKAYGKAV